MKSIIFLILTFLALSCTNMKKQVEERPKLTYVSSSYPTTEIRSELTKDQEAAFDALNTLQTSTDEMNRLYSTFPNHSQPCYPADTSFVISQSELRTTLKQYVSRFCQNLTPKVRNELAETSVLAQDNYTVLHCNTNSYDANYENGLPMIGTWVIPNILERRDLILVW